MTGTDPAGAELTGRRLTESEAMEAAVAASWEAAGRTSPNPAVGAVLLDVDGEVCGVGVTSPPGGPHAEAAALRRAGERARGGTAVVTLEPCDHTGRTGPCTRALIEAGIARVVYAVADPTAAAAGGGAALRAAGVSVAAGLGAHRAQAGPLRPWLHRQRTGRPLVTLKLAATADGRVAAPDGSSRWITGEAARAEAHRRRARLDAIIVGTGTVLADDPALTARRPDGTLHGNQPLRVVAGDRAIPHGSRILDASAPTTAVPGHDPAAVLAALSDRCCDVQVEGGPRVAGAFLAAGLVDRVEHYLAPALLGAGLPAVENAAVRTIADITRFRRTGILELGEDLLLTYDRVAGPGEGVR